MSLWVSVHLLDLVLLWKVFAAVGANLSWSYMSELQLQKKSNMLLVYRAYGANLLFIPICTRAQNTCQYYLTWLRDYQ
jgi:hypothetical protein